MPVPTYLRAGVLLLAAVAALFVSAGTFAILSFWLYWAMLVAVFVAAFALLDRGLLRERMRPGGKPAPLGLRLLNIVLLAHWIIAGLDRGRLHWSDSVPLWLTAWAIRNRRESCSGFLGHGGEPLLFFRGTHPIRARTRRRYWRPVCAFVRHPGYSAGILILAASGIALGSWLAAAFLIAITVPFMLYRVVNEDRVLQSQLGGYADYAHRVP